MSVTLCTDRAVRLMTGLQGGFAGLFVLFGGPFVGFST